MSGDFACIIFLVVEIRRLKKKQPKGCRNAGIPGCTWEKESIHNIRGPHPEVWEWVKRLMVSYPTKYIPRDLSHKLKKKKMTGYECCQLACFCVL